LTILPAKSDKLRILWAFLWRDIRNEMSYRLAFFMELFGILPAVLMFYFLSRLFGEMITGPLSEYGGRYFPFVLIGIAAQSYLSLSLGSFASSIRESQVSGTLEAVLTTPVPLSVFLLGSSLYPFVLNALRIMIYLVVGNLLFEAGLDWRQWPALLVVLMLTVTAVSGLGILSASFTVLFKKGDPLNWAFSVGSWLLGGVYYPVSVLPEWLQKISDFIPMTHTLESFRLILLGHRDLFAVGGHLLALCLWSLMVLPASLLCFRYALNQARIKGNLGHY
jgi:ABC-2 type transport system permease protein